MRTTLDDELAGANFFFPCQQRGLLILLMYFPGGLMQIVYRLRDAVLDWADRRLAAQGVAAPVPAIAKAVPTHPRSTPVPEPHRLLRPRVRPRRHRARWAVMSLV